MTFLHHIARGLPEPLLRETRQGVRCYQTPEGMWYPSMTTVLGFFPNPSLEAWKQRVDEYWCRDRQKPAACC